MQRENLTDTEVAVLAEFNTDVTLRAVENAISGKRQDLMQIARQIRAEWLIGGRSLPHGCMS